MSTYLHRTVTVVVPQIISIVRALEETLAITGMIRRLQH